MSSQPWPPAPYDVALTQFAAWDALYTGQNTNLIGASPAATHVHRGVPHRGGLVGAMSSGVFGRPVTGEQRNDIHIPIPGDLAQLSSELLFSESPKITIADADQGNKAAQKRLELIVASDEGHAELLRSGEYAAAHGGVYLAVVWDATVRDHVWMRAYRADCAIPEWRYGNLSAVTLWTEYAVKDRVYRLLERHSPGRITYSLWRGGEHEKGEQVPVTDLPQTAHYDDISPKIDADRLPEGGKDLDINVPTGVDWLTVEYYPNMLPNPTWDRSGELANLGRSDYYGIEDLFATADFFWSSLVNDFVNGQGRLIVPESYLTLKGTGQGAEFDRFRQVFAAHGGLDKGDARPIDQVQFALRVDEHIAGIEMVKRQVAQSAGYSVSHFGIHDGIARTATEVQDDRSDSERTRDKKALYVRPSLSRLARTALAVDGLLFRGKGGKTIEELPQVEFADVSQVDPEKTARTSQMLDAARGISLYMKVRDQRPGWDEKQVQDEVDRIRADQGPPAPDPTTFTG